MDFARAHVLVCGGTAVPRQAVQLSLTNLKKALKKTV